MVAVLSPAAQPGVLHRYSPRLVAFEHSRNPGAKNLVLWIGGLGDGLHTVSYPALLAAKLPATWGLAQVQLLSSLNGWGTGSLQRDVQELSLCVEYFRKLRRVEPLIVLMGHSTGCQDCMEYVSGEGADGRARINGIILQAPVSDREGLSEVVSNEAREMSVQVARRYVEEGRPADVLPESACGSYTGQVPVSAYRWLSLLSPDGDGDDDYFSSDLTDEKLRGTFGRMSQRPPLLILPSGQDEHVPAHVDVRKLLGRWKDAVRAGGGVVSEHSGIVAGASHNLEGNEEAPFEDLAGRVLGFLREIEPLKVAKT